MKRATALRLHGLLGWLALAAGCLLLLVAALQALPALLITALALLLLRFGLNELARSDPDGQSRLFTGRPYGPARPHTTVVVEHRPER
ncbi:MAG: hypothetical protein ERJ67_05340 [Aphanocapsa feldmannii 277cV]|uniref:Uncharacterized protein n=2 Tax=Aphanocapsa feldmannii TaxID=192050 RepID=A0A524RNJ9_9CHRO|nr:MAG: hypothetical protein ERJ67_05340 [Aphanocapsa feldmannii 277cV]TGH24018.1 MAG: hypothetical protein ERJ68_03560 [Aphanocapsa feldmannii 277cI]